MKTNKFNGNAHAQEILKKIKDELDTTVKTPKLVSILVGDDSASHKYSEMKKKVAEQIGFDMEIKNFEEDVDISDLENEIKSLNQNDNVHGIMIQLPLPKKLISETQKLISNIDPKKDVDGLRENSHFLSATVKAVLKTIDIATKSRGISLNSFAIVGANGEVGSRIAKELENFELILLDKGDSLSRIKDADCVISATGKSYLITSENIKSKATLIDVGAPKPEFSEDCYEKASFYTPVPGGIGPMTIACLMENLSESAKKLK